jgi:hypothetical protein
MKYAIERQDGVTEIREDDHDFPEGAMQLDDEQYNQLISGAYILQNGQIVANPNPPRAV